MLFPDSHFTLKIVSVVPFKDTPATGQPQRDHSSSKGNSWCCARFQHPGAGVALLVAADECERAKIRFLKDVLGIVLLRTSQHTKSQAAFKWCSSTTCSQSPSLARPALLFSHAVLNLPDWISTNFIPVSCA